MLYNDENPRQGGNPGAGNRPFGKASYDSSRKCTTPSLTGAILDFRAFCESHGGLPEEIHADGVRRRCGTSDKPKGKDFSYCLYADGRGGWALNWASGHGVQHWKSERRTHLTPAERAHLAESIKLSNVRREQAAKARKEAQRVSLLLYSLNQTLSLAEARLAVDPDDASAWFALGIIYQWYTRTEYQHDQLLQRRAA